MPLRKWIGSLTGRSGSPAPRPRFTPLLEKLESRETPATFTVTNINDAGPGSLRQAILDANNTMGFDRIVFNIPVDASVPTAFSIRVETSLPPLLDDDGVSIDAFTQPRSAGTNPLVPIVELTGYRLTTLDPNNGDGFSIASDNNVIRGFIINSFPRTGISIFGGSKNIIVGNYVGTDSTGTRTGTFIPSNEPNPLLFQSANKYAQLIIARGDSLPNPIGADDLTLPVGNLSGGQVAQSNVIGGVVGLDNQPLRDAGGELVGARDFNPSTGKNLLIKHSNIFAGTPEINIPQEFNNSGDWPNYQFRQPPTGAGSGPGIRLMGLETSNNLIQGNFIGTDRTGTLDLGNINGIEIFNTASSNIIGGDFGTVAGKEQLERGVLDAVAPQGNVIRFNAFDAIRIAPSPYPASSVPNYGGPTFAFDIWDGPFIPLPIPPFGKSTETAPGPSGGVSLPTSKSKGGGYPNYFVQPPMGDLLGPDPLDGQDYPPPPTTPPPLDNRILGNSIVVRLANSNIRNDMGIDLLPVFFGADAKTNSVFQPDPNTGGLGTTDSFGRPAPNDFKDIDGGYLGQFKLIPGIGNASQNYPLVQVAQSARDRTTFFVSITSQPNRDYRIELFASDAKDSQTNPHIATRYLGFINLSTDDTGRTLGGTLTIAESLDPGTPAQPSPPGVPPIPAQPATFITAIATDLTPREPLPTAPLDPFGLNAKGSSRISIGVPVIAATGSISGVVFVDVNGDGVKQTDEPVVPNAVVTISLDSTGLSQQTPPFTIVADANGLYSATNLPNGTHTIVSAVSADGTLALAAPLTATVFNGEAVTRDIPLQSAPPPLTPPNIAATTPPNGQEGGIYGFQITATGNPAPTFALTGGQLPPGLSIDANGNITGVPTEVGTFSFVVTATNSQGSDSQSFTIVIAPAGSGGVVIIPDPGTGSFAISGTVFNDLNRDGNRGINEPGLGGITILLDRFDPTTQVNTLIASTVSAADGSFRFTGLPAGTYRVRQRLDGSFTQTTPAPALITGAANQQATGVVFGNALNDNAGLSSKVTAVGAGDGGGPLVRVLNADGSLRGSFLAYESTVRNGVRVATGDVDGDGIDEIVTGPGPGGAPLVKVFDSRTFALKSQFFAYATSFVGGIYVATGDLDGDGVAEIITGTGDGGGPNVKAFTGTGNGILSFFPYESTFRGGVLVAAGDLNGDGRDEIITGTGIGGGPRVQAFDGVTLRTLGNFFAYDQSFRNGVFVATADIDGDGKAEILAGAGPGGGPNVKVVSGSTFLDLASFFAFPSTSRGGVRVGSADIDGDGIDEIVAGAGPGQPPTVNYFDGITLSPKSTFQAFDSNFLGGVWVS